MLIKSSADGSPGLAQVSTTTATSTSGTPGFPPRPALNEDRIPWVRAHAQSTSVASPITEQQGNEEPEPEDGWIMPEDPNVAKNTPGRPGTKWQMMEGSDLAPPEFGKPDVSKFFLIRVDRSDSSHIFVHRFPHIADFNWWDAEDIDTLKKGRRQIITRTNGISNTPRPQWTQLERELLEREVREALDTGTNVYELDWKQVAVNINNQLAGVKQAKGSQMSRRSKWIPRVFKDGIWVEGYEKANPKKKDVAARLPNDRIGSNREASGCRAQANNFGAIKNMLDEAKKRLTRPGGRPKKAAAESGEDSAWPEDDDMEDNEDVENTPQPAARQPATTKQGKRKQAAVNDDAEVEVKIEETNDFALPSPKRRKSVSRK